MKTYAIAAFAGVLTFSLNTVAANPPEAWLPTYETDPVEVVDNGSIMIARTQADRDRRLQARRECSARTQAGQRECDAIGNQREKTQCIARWNEFRRKCEANIR